MKILVTGGAGFLGSHLIKKLLTDGHSVICLDNLQTGNISNIEKFLNNSKFQFIEEDIINPTCYTDKVDQIYNLACPASPPRYQKNPIHTIHTSYQGVWNMLNLAKEYKAKFLQASTSEIYGDPLQHPQTETYWGNVNPIGPRSCYDEGKRIAETLCFEFRNQYNLDTKIVRIFNTYGPNMDPNDGRVVSNFITQALKNQDITIYGNGSQTRSFCYVDDLINGIYKVMQTPKSEMGPYNLGNPNEFTIEELSSLVLKLIPTKSKIIYKDLPIDDPKQRRPNIEKAFQELNWQPTIDLETGLKNTIQYFKKIITLQYSETV